MLSVQQLLKSYPAGNARQVVFDRLDLDVPTGQVVALLGASGSGKTTLLNLLSGIDTPDDGHVLVADTDVHALMEPERTLFRRHRIGFVFQFFNLIPTLTVAENLSLPLELTGAPPAVARAMAHSPDLLLGDEPTGNLDEATGERVTSLLVSLARDHGTTLLIVTHSTTVARAADRVLRLHHGRLTAS